MGRYSTYFEDIWKIQANRKVIGINLFGVIFDNTSPFTPGQQLIVLEGVDQAIQVLTNKGYDFLFVVGQPSNRTRALGINDFENILASTRELFSQLGGRVKNAYYSPGTDKNDPYVKPNPGMFERAQNEGMIKWEETYYVGVDANDVKAAAKVKTKPILIKSSNALKMKAFELTHTVKIQEHTTFLEFAQNL